MDRQCTKCLGTFDEAVGFHKNRGRVRSWCKQCVITYSKTYQKTHPEYVLLRRARHNAKVAGVDFDLTLDCIFIPASCPILGIPIFFAVNGARSDNSPSLDRIDSKKGYVKGNVHVVSWRANKIKQDATVDEMRAWVDFLDKRAEASLT